MHPNLPTILATFALITSALTLPSPLANPPSTTDLTYRSCKADGCVATKGIKSGIYCGYCGEVQGTQIYGNVYQLNGDDGSCCDFGPKDACAAGALVYDTRLCGPSP